MSEYNFITSHGRILVAIADYHGKRKTAREIADEVGITERATHKIIIDLERDGYITKTKVGRQSSYQINPDMPIKVTNATVGDLLKIFGWRHRRRRAKIDASQNT